MGRATSSKPALRSCVSGVTTGLLLCFVVMLAFLLSHTAFALEPPHPGEIERLKQTGEYAERLERARALGNHLIDRDLLDEALYKVQREALIQQGFPVEEILPAPPPSRKLMPTKGNVKVFALLIDFPDYPAYNTQAGIHSALFGDGSGIPSNAAPYESLRNFYQRSSYNQLDLSSGVTLGWYRATYTRASMAQTTAARETLIKEAIASFDGSVDFSQFDNYGNGQIEYCIVVWTGPDNGWSNFWWGYGVSFTDQTFTVDGKRLGKYSWQWEYNNGSAYQGLYSPTTVIHETGHGLGLPDYYDYDDTVGPGGGVGGLDIMDGVWGDHNSFSKWVLEWITPTVVASGSQTITLGPSGTSQDAVLVMPGATSADPFREFFIAQNRYRAGNDYHAGYPTDGMLIWHVDASLNAAATDYKYNNFYTPHKLLKLMQADGLDRIENSEATADAAMYYEPGKVLGPVSAPSSKDYMGVDTRVNVTGISQSWPQMSATFSIDATSTLATLTVAKAGAGSGAVTSVPDGISCGSDCRESYVPRTVVTLHADSSAGSAFAGWSGGGCSGLGTCTVTMSADTTVTATFNTTLVLDEDFDPVSASSPSGWTTQRNAGGAYWWFTYTNYNTTGGSGGCALGASSGGGPYDSELRTLAINLSAYDSVGLEFKTSVLSSAETADVDVSTNGAAGPWTNVWRKIGGFTGPQTVNVDISSVAGRHSNVMLRFRHTGTGIWWVIDDVKVMATASSPETVSTPSTPSGLASGTTRVIYSYSTGGSSSNVGHSVQYFFDWGDGTNSGWLPVGTTSASKSWASAGTYTVEVQARCSSDTSVVSSWSGFLSVNISACPNLTVRRARGSYNAIQDAYNGAVDGDIIQSQAVFFSENLDFHLNISVTIRGGYDCYYSTNDQKSVVNGAITIRNGTVTIENIIIR